MNYFLKIVSIFFGIIFIVNIFPLIFNFLNIKFSSYSIYMYWVIALMIMFIILPSNKNDILKVKN